MRVHLSLYTCNSIVIDNRFGYFIQHSQGFLKKEDAIYIYIDNAR